MMDNWAGFVYSPPPQEMTADLDSGAAGYVDLMVHVWGQSSLYLYLYLYRNIYVSSKIVVKSVIAKKNCLDLPKDCVKCNSKHVWPPRQKDKKDKTAQISNDCLKWKYKISIALEKRVCKLIKLMGKFYIYTQFLQKTDCFQGKFTQLEYTSYLSRTPRIYSCKFLQI